MPRDRELKQVKLFIRAPKNAWKTLGALLSPFFQSARAVALRRRLSLLSKISCALRYTYGILKSWDVFISMRRGRAWKKRARRTATASLPLWARIPRVYIWNNELECTKDAICERPPTAPDYSTKLSFEPILSNHIRFTYRLSWLCLKWN